MSYGNHLSRIRAQNYAAGISAIKGNTVTIDTCNTCPQSPPIVQEIVRPVGIQMLGQSRISNFHVHVGTTFEDSNISSVCCVPFMSTYVPPHTRRLIRVSASLVLVDPTPNRTGNLFLSLFLGGVNVYNLCEEYHTNTGSIQFTKSVLFVAYLDVPVSAENSEIELCATCSSDTCYFSASRGAYSQEFPVGLSYLSVEDVAGI